MPKALVALFAVAALSGPVGFTAPGSAQGVPAPSGGTARGRTLFMTVGCYECHGTVAQGNYFGGPKLAPPLPYPALAAYVRRPAGLMPSFDASVLPDRDLTDIYAYLQSLPKWKKPAEIPLLSAVRAASR